MRIFRCVRKNLIVQGYGPSKTQKSLIPLYNSLDLPAHDGLDFAVDCKDYSVKVGGQCENVYCDIDGYATITYIQKDVKGGFGIIAQDQDKNFKHLWWHFDSINPLLKVGSIIRAGDLLGVAGTTGKSTGPHVHRATYMYGMEDNGYNGALDPELWYTNIFILDYLQTMNNSISVIEKFKSIIPNFQDIIDKIKKGFLR